MPETKPELKRSRKPKDAPRPTPAALAPINDGYFPSVKKARAALMARAHETYEKLMKIIDMAAASGDFETAAKYTWQLLEHTPKEEGDSIIAESAAKPKMVEGGPRGPVIQIGFNLGGVEAKQLEPAIEAEKINDAS